MESLFKKVLYTGVGIVSTANEKIQQTVNELVDKGKISEEEGKKIVNEWADDLEAKKDEYEGKLSSLVSKVVESLNLPSRKELTSLKGKIKQLEAQLNPSELVEEAKDAAKKAVKKVKKSIDA